MFFTHPLFSPDGGAVSDPPSADNNQGAGDNNGNSAGSGEGILDPILGGKEGEGGDQDGEVVKTLMAKLEEEKKRRAGLDKRLAEMQKALDEFRQRSEQFELGIKSALGIQQDDNGDGGSQEEDPLSLIESLQAEVQSLKQTIAERDKQARREQAERLKIQMLTEIDPNLAGFADQIRTYLDPDKQREAVDQFVGTFQEVIKRLGVSNPPPLSVPSSRSATPEPQVDFNAAQKRYLDALMSGDQAKIAEAEKVWQQAMQQAVQSL